MKCPNCNIKMINIQDTIYFCEECELDIPMTNKAQSFLNSLVGHMANGFQSVDDAIKEQRLSICRECEHFSEKNSKCHLCGCFLKIKTSWASEECPIGLWKAVTEKKRRKGCGGCRSNKKS